MRFERGRNNRRAVKVVRMQHVHGKLGKGTIEKLMTLMFLLGL